MKDVDPYFDKYEAIALLATMSVPAVIEALGLTVNERTVYRWARKAYGTIPTKAQLARPDARRDALAARMELEGLDRRYCLHGHRMFRQVALIRWLGGNDHVFVCRKHAKRGDF